jgi:transcriptional regulator with PAS, ATPase and Fis domain
MQSLARIIGNEQGLREVVQRARRLAGVDATVLLGGETGVGKAVFARAIHEESQNRHGPFVGLNCGGLSRELLASELFGHADGTFKGTRRSGKVGKIEAAHGGTLFLDEIAELPLELQPYLLRVLEGGELYPLGGTTPRQVRFRLISASNRQLRTEISQGRFRTDLYYRISVTYLHIPALRERTQDLPALVSHFADDAAKRYGIPSKRFSVEVAQAFARYSWPGNVRELRNVVEAMVLLAPREVVDLSSLPAELMPPGGAAAACRRLQYGGLGRAERDTICAAIRTRQGNLAQAAKDLRISRSTLYLKVKQHALDPLLTEARLS